MGILNVTPDSFSDGGQFAEPSSAVEAGVRMASQGAAILDVGGESTRPGAQQVWAQDEIERVRPVVERLADERRRSLHRYAQERGDDRRASGRRPAGERRVGPDLRPALGGGRCGRSSAPVILMHHLGPPETMQQDPRYDDVLVEVYLWLEERIAAAEAAGIDRSRILIDPGFGFGKTVAHNLELMNGLALFHSLGCPIVLGASRKRTIGALSNEAPADERLGGSIAFALKAVEQGAQIVRVHDVPETVQALRVWRGLRDQALTPRIG